MKNGSKIKYDLLGEPFGTASNKLKKSILFMLVQKLELDICYRCKEKIEDIKNFSIEHKTSWQFAENPIKAFYDLENITFSHLKCNVQAGARKMSPHGTFNRYGHHGCRCDECTKANTLHARQVRARKKTPKYQNWHMDSP